MVGSNGTVYPSWPCVRAGRCTVASTERSGLPRLNRELVWVVRALFQEVTLSFRLEPSQRPPPRSQRDRGKVGQAAHGTRDVHSPEGRPPAHCMPAHEFEALVPVDVRLQKAYGASLTAAALPAALSISSVREPHMQP